MLARLQQFVRPGSPHRVYDLREGEMSFREPALQGAHRQVERVGDEGEVRGPAGQATAHHNRDEFVDVLDGRQVGQLAFRGLIQIDKQGSSDPLQRTDSTPCRS